MGGWLHEVPDWESPVDGRGLGSAEHFTQRVWEVASSTPYPVVYYVYCVNSKIDPMAWIVWTRIGYLSVYSILYSCLFSVLYCMYQYLTVLCTDYSPFLPHDPIPYTWHIGILTDTVLRTLQQNNTAQPSQAKHDTKIDIPTAPKTKSQSMIFRSTNGSVTSSWSVCVCWTEGQTKMQAGSSGNARDES